LQKQKNNQCDEEASSATKLHVHHTTARGMHFFLITTTTEKNTRVEHLLSRCLNVELLGDVDTYFEFAREEMNKK
jgi:hypothetical protein